MSKIVKSNKYQFKVVKISKGLYQFIPVNFDHLPTVAPFIAIDNSYYLLKCKPAELENYIVKLSQELGKKDLESMQHFYDRLANDTSKEKIVAYHKPSKFTLSMVRRKQEQDKLTAGKFHHHTYKPGTFWDFLAGVWWGDHFNR